MAKRTDVLSHLPGFHREYTIKNGKKTNQRFISEDGTINLSVRQAQDVAKGTKSLSEAIAISVKGKKVPGGMGWKSVPTESYQFKDLFDARDFVINNKALHGKMMFLSGKGIISYKYKAEEGGKAQWKSVLTVVNSKTYTSDKYWERAIDKLGDIFEGDPKLIAITYLR